MFDPTRLRAWERAIEARISARGQALLRWAAGIAADESAILLVLGGAIGATVGLAVLGFYKLIDLAQGTLLSAADRLTGTAGPVSILLIVLVGFGLARALVRWGAADSEGENIPDIMRAVAKRASVIRGWPVAIKTASAAITIGAGGSAGAEGPVAVAGAALGSRIGRFFRSGPERLKLLVACGSAAGISAAFNAPIAGVFFSLEKVLGTFAVSTFPPVLVASVIAAVISRATLGDVPVIRLTTQYTAGPAWEFALYALLGVATGVVSVLFTRMVHGTAAWLARLRSWWVQILTAGLVVAVLNIAFRADLWGRGHQSLSLDTIGRHQASFLVALALAKVVGTAFTVAATRSGGVFTPALFIGATLGGGLGAAARDLLPDAGIAPLKYALVGMAGLVAGSAHAPLTAVMIVFEITHDYAMILPLMLCGAVALISARRIHPNSIYSEWLVLRGERIAFGQDAALLERLTVRDCYDRQPHVLAERATVRDIAEALGATTQIEFPVLDGDGRLVGMVNYDDLRSVISRAGELSPLIVASDLMSDRFERVTPEDSLKTALQRLALRGSHHIPVVDGNGGHRLLGLIGRGAILAAYDRELLKAG
jgi:CIC family chloride channel protein